MGYDTKLYMSRKWSKAEIVDMIHNTIKIKYPNAVMPTPVIGSTGCGDHLFLHYKRDEVGHGMLMVHESEIGGIEAIMISSSFNDNAIELFKTIGERYGGLFIENDGVDEIVEYQGQDIQDMQWVIKQIMVGGAHYDHDHKTLNRYIDETVEELNKLRK